MLPLPALPRPLPDRVTLEGAYARLEPLSAATHFDTLLEAVTGPAEEERFRYLFEARPDALGLRSWFETAQASSDPLFFALVDRATGRCEGRQALMRITPEHGVIEVGSIYWGPRAARTRLATEAVYLLAEYVFITLGYRRFEWKCDARNEPSRRAALRFGFRPEGVFAQHMVVKGQNRDTAWFAMLDHDWPALATAYRRWLAPENFMPEGRQLEALAVPRGDGAA